MKPFVTFLEFPPESLPRPRFRQFIRHIEKQPWYGGHDGRKVYFQFDTQAGGEEFLKSFSEMMAKRGVQSTTVTS